MSRDNTTMLQDPSNILAALDKMREDDKLCDFRIVAGKTSFPVHRNILIANSEYFRAMFSHAMKESNEGYAEIGSATPEAVEACILFMYCRKPDITPENAIDILQVSHMLQLTGLTSACTKLLEKSLTVQNCLLVKRISRIYDAEELCEAADAYIADHFTSVAESDDFATITSEEITEILRAAEPMRFYKLWAIVKTWIEHDPERRQKAFAGFFHAVNFQDAPFDILWDQIYKLPWLDPATKKLVKQAIVKKVGALDYVIDMENWKQLRNMVAENVVPDSGKALNQIFHFVQYNLDAISEEDSFKNFTYEEVEMCIPRAVTAHSHLPLMMWNAILKWIKARKESREAHLKELIGKLLTAVRFDVMMLGCSTLYQKMLEEPIVRNSPEYRFPIVEKISDLIVQEVLSLQWWTCVKYKLVFVGVRKTSATINAETMVDEYIRKNIAALIFNEEYLSLDEASASVILSCLNSYWKMFGWKAIHNWTKHDPSRAFHMLLRSIALNCYSSLYLRKTIASHLPNGSCMHDLVTDTALARDIQGKDTYIVFADSSLGAFVGYSPMNQDWVLFQEFPHVDCLCESSHLFTVQGRRVYSFQGHDLYRMMGQGYGVTWAKLQRIPINITASSCAAILRGDIHVINERVTLYYRTGQYTQEIDTKWRKFERMEPDRWRASQTLIADEENNFLYCIGGLDDDGDASRKVDKFLNDDDRWIDMPDMLVGRVHPAACVHNGNVYVFGGRDEDGDVIDHAEYYNTSWSGGIWQKLRDMPYIMKNISACVVNNRIFVFGGLADQLVFTEYDTVDRRRRWSTVGVVRIDHSRLRFAGVAQM